MEITTANFEELYLDMKADGKTDREIAKELQLTRCDLTSIKKFLDVPDIRCRKNLQGLSEKELRQAERNGIDRRLALRRKRLLGWSNLDCITIKNLGKSNRRKK
jgi:hypothetical protein